MNIFRNSRLFAGTRRNVNGFSLLEMLIVVSIILILATIAVPKFTSAALYEIDNGEYPSSVADLVNGDETGKSYLQGEPTLPDGTKYSIDSEGVVSGTFDGITYDSASNQMTAGSDVT